MPAWTYSKPRTLLSAQNPSGRDHGTAAMGSVVFCVGGCSSVPLEASVATTASDLMSNQRQCGWDDVIFMHAFIQGDSLRFHRD